MNTTENRNSLILEAFNSIYNKGSIEIRRTTVIKIAEAIYFELPIYRMISNIIANSRRI